MVKNYKPMTQMKLLRYFGPRTLAKFRQINKDCNQLMDPKSMTHCINYLRLFKSWGISPPPADVSKTEISASRALQVAAKCMMLKSIVKSQRIIGRDYVKHVTGTSSIPNMQTLA